MSKSQGPRDPLDPGIDPVTLTRKVDIASEKDPDAMLAIALLERQLSRYELVVVLAGTFKDIRQREREAVIAEVKALLDVVKDMPDE